MDGSGIGRMMAGAMWIVFLLGMLGTAVLAAFGWLIYWLWEHLQWI